MTITLRATKGSALTTAELDGNFTDLDDRVATLEGDTATLNSISNITMSGSQLTITTGDGTSYTFTVPRAPFRPTVTQTVSGATHSPVASDANGYIRCTNAAGCVVTLPADAEEDIPVDSEICYRQAAAMPVSFEAATGVTLNGVTGYLNETSGEGALVTVKKVAADAWDIIGLLAEDVTG